MSCLLSKVTLGLEKSKQSKGMAQRYTLKYEVWLQFPAFPFKCSHAILTDLPILEKCVP